MPDWNPLKARLPMRVFPGNIEYVRAHHARHDLQSFQLVLLGIGGFSIDPGFVRQDGLLPGFHGGYDVEPDMRLGRTSPGGFFLFQEDSQNLNRLEGVVGFVC